MQNQDVETRENPTVVQAPNNAESPENQRKPSIGVGVLIADSVSLVFSRLVMVVILGFVPNFVGQLLTGLLAGVEITMGSEAFQYGGIGGDFASLLGAVIGVAAYALTIALLIQFAYDDWLDRPVRIGRYLRRAFATLLPNIVLSTAIFLTIAIVVLGLFFLIGRFLPLPGFVAMISLMVLALWIYSVFSVTVPAVVIGGDGFLAMGRSMTLTKDYRWPIIGAFALTGIIVTILFLVFGFLIALVGGLGGGVAFGIAVVLLSVLSAICSGIISVLTALIYTRLREIKEGTSLDQIATVFD